jgi:hypothetical protein
VRNLRFALSHWELQRALWGFESLENYQKQVDAIREILKGILKKV